MENINKEQSVVKNGEIFKVWIDNKKDFVAVFDWVVGRLKNSYGEEEIESIKNKVKMFCRNADRRWQKHSRSFAILKKADREWLECEAELLETVTAKPRGRPKLQYDMVCERQKRKIASTVSLEQGHNSNLLLHAASISAKHSKETDLHYVLNAVNKSPCRPSKIKKLIDSKVVHPIPLSPEDAMAFLLENNFTKQQYNNIRQLSKSRNSDIYPHYNKLLEYKSQCRPNGIKITETTAVVPLQNLLDHTVKRILLLQEDVLLQFKGDNTLTLILSYGFDGSSGHSQFKQKFFENTPESFDQSLFVTSIIPLKLVTQSGKIIWWNSTPQSIKFCRPLKIQFVKETKEHILNEKKRLDLEISNLKSLKYNTSNDTRFDINYSLNMTLIDGKVLNVLTDTKSTQVCAICGAGPKMFMSVKDLKSPCFEPRSDSLQYGISPLHAWIRCFEFILHLSYKLDLKIWQVRSKEHKEQIEKKKREIQKHFWDEMGLHVDKPKTNGSGNTNDGNTARRAFSNAELFASITKIDLSFLKRLHIILVAISCEYEVNTQLFQNYCEETAKLYFQLYDWNPMTPTLHKLLVHSSQILEFAILPLGVLGENASEARNKIYKSDRIGHARKDSRVHNMEDVFNRAMDSSDPLLSSLRKNNKAKQKLSLPPAVVSLLKMPDISNECELPSTSKAALSETHYESEEDLYESLYSFELETDHYFDNCNDGDVPDAESHF